MKRYHGRRTDGGPRIVWVEDDDGRLRWLPPRQDLWDHGGMFDWGPLADSAAAAQLALALLADAAGDAAAVRHYHDFTWQEVLTLGDKWDLTDAWLLVWRPGP